MRTCRRGLWDVSPEQAISASSSLGNSELYLLLIPNNGLFNNNDAATVAYIVSHPTAFWAGYVFFLLSAGFRLIQMLLFYELFQPVNTRLALLAVYFNSVATTLQAAWRSRWSCPSSSSTARTP
jgi:hypothetical protein